MSKRICGVGHGIYDEKRCPKCKKSNNKRYDKSKRDPALKKFYNSTKWRRISRSFLSLNPLCIMCGRPAKITDHKEEIREGGEKYDKENLQPMCISCHNKKTAEERAKREGGAKSLESKDRNTEPPSKFLQSSHEGGTP